MSPRKEVISCGCCRFLSGQSGILLARQHRLSGTGYSIGGLHLPRLDTNGASPGAKRPTCRGPMIPWARRKLFGDGGDARCRRLVYPSFDTYSSYAAAWNLVSPKSEHCIPAVLWARETARGVVVGKSPIGHQGESGHCFRFRRLRMVVGLCALVQSDQPCGQTEARTGVPSISAAMGVNLRTSFN